MFLVCFLGLSELVAPSADAQWVVEELQKAVALDVNYTVRGLRKGVLIDRPADVLAILATLKVGPKEFMEDSETKEKTHFDIWPGGNDPRGSGHIYFIFGDRKVVTLRFCQEPISYMYEGLWIKECPEGLISLDPGFQRKIEEVLSKREGRKIRFAKDNPTWWEAPPP
jgi:hypothetical protein